MPVPVCPYANTVPLRPCMRNQLVGMVLQLNPCYIYSPECDKNATSSTRSTSRDAPERRKTSFCDVLGPKAWSTPKCLSHPPSFKGRISVDMINATPVTCVSIILTALRARAGSSKIKTDLHRGAGRRRYHLCLAPHGWCSQLLTIDALQCK